MIRGFAAAVAAVCIAGTASAADLGRMPVKAPPMPMPYVTNWSGFYLGAHVGYGWGESKWDDGFGNTYTSKPDGFLGGGQIGYNWQFPNNWLLGLEGQIAGTGISKSVDFVGPGGVLWATAGTDLNWLASITGRLGYAANNWLLYAKGGVAFAGIEHHLNFVLPGPVSASESTSHTGWTVGAGAEWMFAPQWSALVEYQYYDFGSKDYALAGQFIGSVSSDIHTFKVGVNYHFGPRF